MVRFRAKWITTLLALSLMWALPTQAVFALTQAAIGHAPAEVAHEMAMYQSGEHACCPAASGAAAQRDGVTLTDAGDNGPCEHVVCSKGCSACAHFSAALQSHAAFIYPADHALAVRSQVPPQDVFGDTESPPPRPLHS